MLTEYFKRLLYKYQTPQYRSDFNTVLLIRMATNILGQDKYSLYYYLLINETQRKSSVFLMIKLNLGGYIELIFCNILQ